jgi:hypothetical protein
MYLLGHTDARFTLRVYQQVLDAAPGSLDVLERLMGCSREEAREIFESGAVSRARRNGVANELRTTRFEARPGHGFTAGRQLRSAAFAGTSWKADDGTRTHDLLHGNRSANSG